LPRNEITFFFDVSDFHFFQKVTSSENPHEDVENLKCSGITTTSQINCSMHYVTSNSFAEVARAADFHFPRATTQASGCFSKLLKL